MVSSEDGRENLAGDMYELGREVEQMVIGIDEIHVIVIYNSNDKLGEAEERIGSPLDITGR